MRNSNTLGLTNGTDLKLLRLLLILPANGLTSEERIAIAHGSIYSFTILEVAR